MEWWPKRIKHSFCHISSLSGNTVSLLCLLCCRLVKRPDRLIFQSPLFSPDGFNPLMFHWKPPSPSLPCVFRHLFSFLSQPFSFCSFSNFEYLFFLHSSVLNLQVVFFSPLFDVTTLSSPRLQRRHQGPPSCLKSFWYANPKHLRFIVPFLCALYLKCNHCAGYFRILWSCAIHLKFLKRISAKLFVLQNPML